MTAGGYLLGVALSCLVVGSLYETGSVVRRVLLPDWRGAPARLAEAVVAIATLLLLSELLGTVGLFKRWPLVGGCVALGFAALVTDRRVRPGAARRPPAEVARPGRTGAATVAGWILIVFLLLLPWTYTTLNAIHHGIREYDSLSYHLPLAARFAQTGSTTGIQYMGNPPVSFYPMNAELVHAVGMLLFGRDFLSLAINFGWLGLALLASWCIGRPRGLGVGTMAATALVLSVRVMAFSQGGTAKNDVASISLLLASIALVSQRETFGRELIVAAVAAGLSVGTRLTLWVPALALGVLVTAAAPRGRRASAAGLWLVGIILGGGYWYARNLARVGNPVPWLGGRILGLLTLRSTSAPVDCGTTDVAHYLPHPGFLAAHVGPQLDPFLGRLWWIVIGLAALGTMAGLLSPAAQRERALALLALVAGIGYVLTPATAGGTGASCFGFNTRFLVPALVLGTMLVPLWLASHRIPVGVAVVGCGLVIAVDAHIPLTGTPVLVSALVALCIGAGAALGQKGPSRAALATGTVVLGALAIVGGWEVQRTYFHNRYMQPRLQQPVDSAAAALRDVSDARIAVSGFFETYPLYGVGLMNRVVVPATLVGARFRTDLNCRAWLAALARGRYNFVVTAHQATTSAPAAAWTRRFPGARELRASATTRMGKSWRWEVFSLPRRVPVDPIAACA